MPVMRSAVAIDREIVQKRAVGTGRMKELLYCTELKAILASHSLMMHVHVYVVP